MNSIEIEAKTIDLAIEKACQEFNVSREKLNIEILSEGSSGILGIGAKKARIKAGLLSLDMDFGRAAEEEALQEKPVTRPPVREAPRRQPEPEKIKAVEKSAPRPFVSEGESVAWKAKELLEGILKRMTLDFPVEVEETQDAVILKIEGDGSGVLIGKGGQTLDAIQYILNKAVSTSKDNRRIILDTEEYRERREEYLIALATKLAEKVKKTRKPVTLNLMSARDRRIVHMALKSESALVTKSRGEGSYRKVVIMPARKSGPHRSKAKPALEE